MAGGARYRGHGRVDDIDPGLAALNQGRRLHTTRIMGVEVDRHTQFLPQHPHQLVGGIGTAQPRHVLDAENVSTHGLEPSGQIRVVVEAVLGTPRIEEFAL